MRAKIHTDKGILPAVFGWPAIHVRKEKLSYKAFQKLYGSSVGLRAPEMFMEKLRRKAENAGGKLEDINTRSTKLSQACHCGRYEKKARSKRWHKCLCGAEAQRDLYSAYLACFVEKIHS